MKIFKDREITDEYIEDIIYRDSLGRNSYVSSLSEILVAFGENNSGIISLDGEWGSGKTILVKELEYLILANDDKIRQLKETHASSDSMEMLASNSTSLRNKYIPIYYNAWEHDYMENATEALYYELLKELLTKGERLKDMLKGDFSALLSGIVEALVDRGVAAASIVSPAVGEIAKLSKSAREKQKGTIMGKAVMSTNNVARQLEVREYMGRLIEEGLGLSNNGKKLLFIIDDIDRCRPDFALSTLEAIKHSFSNENIVFLVASNNAELSRIISGIYGGQINGELYLNKIFDLQLQVPMVDIGKYVNTIFRNQLDGESTIPGDVAKSFKMNIREANRYLSMLSLISTCVTSGAHIAGGNELRYFREFIMVVLYGLRVVDPALARKMIRDPKGGMLKDLLISHDDLAGRSLDFLLGFNLAPNANHRDGASISDDIFMKVMNNDENNYMFEKHRKALLMADSPLVSAS